MDMKKIVIGIVAVVCIVPLLVISYGRQKDANATRAQVRGICVRLDAITDDAGIHIKTEVNEVDLWGKKIEVLYSRGGLMETVKVRSAGRDGIFYNGDDIVAHGSSVNFAGIGSGIKKNIEETANNAAKGATEGIIDGAHNKKKKLGDLVEIFKGK